MSDLEWAATVARLTTERDDEHLARVKAEAHVREYEERLTAVMPPDFKDWHENSRQEWPLVAALTITNLREQQDFWLKEAEHERELRKAAFRDNREKTEAVRELRELLAVVNRDGGHHAEEVGTAQAVKDAIATSAAAKAATEPPPSRRRGREGGR